MAQTLDNFSEALRIDYLPVVRSQLVNANILTSKIARNERDVSGSQWRMVTHILRNSGVGSGTETGLPTAGQQEYANPYGVIKYTRGRIQVSGKWITLGPLIERLMGIITFLNSVNILLLSQITGQYRANRMYAGV